MNEKDKKYIDNEIALCCLFTVFTSVIVTLTVLQYIGVI